MRFRGLLLCVAACALLATATTTPRSGLAIGEVMRLRRSRDYFALRERLAATHGDSAPATLLARGIVEHAMNHPAASNDALRRLRGSAPLDDSVLTAVWEIESSNDLRLADYAAGAAIADSMVSGRVALDSLRLFDARNQQRLLHSLVGTPPQAMTARGPSVVPITEGRIPVVVNGSRRQYVFDTGANLSTIMRSEAANLGLRIIPTGLDVGTATATRITADLGVADSVRIGAMEFRHVVFLVLDDALLTFPGNFRIPGIIGFPVIERMGEIRLQGRATLAVPATPPARPQGNLLLDELTLLTPARWEGRRLLCRLDTGAGRSQLYEPFYRRFRGEIDARSLPAERARGGAGGLERTPVRVLSNVPLAVGDTVASLRKLDVLVRSIARDERENFLDCNLGHDVFDAFGETIVNFRDMAFLLR